jgi:two-component system nitrogen regulation response regulator GlnG
LVVDDEPSISWGLTRLGQSLGREVVAVSSAENALEEARRGSFDAVVLDVRLPGRDGLSVMAELREYLGEEPNIVITAYGDLQTAIEAVRRGAFEYLVKPFDLDRAQRVIERALAAHCPAPPPAEVSQAAGFVGTAPTMQQVFKHIALAANSDAGVLLTGESGAGKELAARAIHRFSRRSGGPFVAVNIAALSPSLVESELFGHVRGAFTGADQDRIGLLVQANGGTLFLDEAAEIPPAVQVKLLRVLDQGEVVPVGGSETVKSDFRVISATHQDLVRNVEAGTFRHDLYFRLASFQLHLPPLRERRDDIESLAEHFLSRAAAGGDRRPRLSPEALVELKRRPWRGNVRELRNALEHAATLAGSGVIAVEHLPPPAPLALLSGESQGDDPNQIANLIARWTEVRLASGDAEGMLHEQLLAIVEPPLIREALRRHHNQVAAAARELGLHRTTLKKKIGQYGIEIRPSRVDPFS